MLYITESAIVKLANVVDAAEFEQLHGEGRIRMPFFASIKVYCRPSKPSAVQPLGIHSKPAQSAQSENDFDCFIVDAAEQDLNQIPSVRSTRLLSIMSHSVVVLLPAKLAMIRKSDHYTMAVHYSSQAVPPELTQVASTAKTGATMSRHCSRAFALVLSNKRSKISPAGTSGHKLVTEDVVDFLDA